MKAKRLFLVAAFAFSFGLSMFSADTPPAEKPKDGNPAKERGFGDDCCGPAEEAKPATPPATPADTPKDEKSPAKVE